jgi:hypothetical protein
VVELPTQVGRLDNSALLIADVVAMKKFVPQVEASFEAAKLEVVIEDF